MLPNAIFYGPASYNDTSKPKQMAKPWLTVPIIENKRYLPSLWFLYKNTEKELKADFKMNE